jgi:hypothetical protein
MAPNDELERPGQGRTHALCAQNKSGADSTPFSLSRAAPSAS